MSTHIQVGDTASGDLGGSFPSPTLSSAVQASINGKQPLDSDLTTIAGLVATTDNFMVATASAWASRTPAQARVQMGLGTLATQSGTFSGTSSGTNTGDQIIPTTLPPSGTAGGDLAGSYPNPTLGTVGTSGTKGSASSVPVFVTDTKGRVTSNTDTPIAITESQVTGLITDLSNKQPLDSDLTTIAGLTATTDNFIQSKGSAWASRTVAQVKTDLGLTGTNSGDQTISLTGDVTGSGTGSFGTALSTTGVSASTYGDSVNVPVFTVDAKGRISGVTNTPISFGSGTTKAICIYATAAALPTNIYSNGASGVGATLTGVSVGALTVDGRTVVSGQRILVKDEVADARNGIYMVTTVGSGIAVYVLTRATDFDSTSEVAGGDLVPIDSDPYTSGVANDDTVFITVTSATPTIGTTAIDFAASGKTYSAGTALTLTGTTFNTQADGTSVDVNGSNQLRRMAVTGDISIPTGSATATLPNIVTGATVGSSTQIPVLTYNNKGQVTSSTTATPTVSASTQRTFVTAMGF